MAASKGGISRGPDAFRVVLSGDFRREDGSPLFPAFDLSQLLARTDVLCSYAEHGPEIRATDIADADALILLGSRLTRSSFAPEGRLALVARFGVGYDDVDVEACTENGIALVNVPDAVRRPVAIAILTLMLALSSRLLVKDRLAREGPAGWAERSRHHGVGLVGRTLGSLGAGNIARELFRLSAPLEMRHIAYDPYVDAATAARLGITLVDLETLFREADVLCINCPLTSETRRLVDGRLLELMKPTAFLINTARGPIVDQAALTVALEKGRIAGAGLDVFEREPPDPRDPLLAREDVILAPHALAWTDELAAGNGAGDIAAVLDVMHGREPHDVVNRAVLKSPLWLRRLASFRDRFGEEPSQETLSRPAAP
jgi:D-3-phosphoglycerate dehydrogenase